MQTDGNRFWNDVALDSFNKSFRDEDNNSDQRYKSTYARFFYDDFKSSNIIQKYRLT